MEKCIIYRSRSDYLLWLQTDDWVGFFFMFFEMFKCSTFLSFFSMANPGLIDLIIQPK